MSDTDTDINLDSGGDLASEIASHEARDAAEEARFEHDRKQDAKLDSVVRKAAEKHYNREQREADALARGRSDAPQSIEDTVRQSYARIAARPEQPSMPLRAGASVEEAVEASQNWAALSKADQRGLADKMEEIASMREASKALGLELSDADVLKLVQDADRQKNAQAPQGAPSPVWQKIGIGDEVQSEAEAMSRLNDFADRHHDTFARHGLSMAQGLEYLVAAQEIFERDPVAAINQLAEQYGLKAAQQATSAMPALVDEWSATKAGGVDQATRRAMAEVIMTDPKLAASDMPVLQVLNAAYSEVRRRAAVRAKREPHKRLEDRVDDAAYEIYSRPRQ